MDNQEIIDQLNRINHFYSNLKDGATAQELVNFNLKSRIKTAPWRNSSFSKHTGYQLHQIYQLVNTNEFQTLIARSNLNNDRFRSPRSIIQAILKIYQLSSAKIFVINNFLSTQIHSPYVEDLYALPHLPSKLHRLLSRYYRIKTGDAGEKYTYDANLFEGDPFITDINFPDKYSKYFYHSRPNAQIDLTMINKWGVFLLEVKHYSAPFFEIGHNGQIITKDYHGHKKYRMNIVEQITRHETAMRHFLNDHHVHDINVQSIIICANRHAKVRSYCPNTHIFFPQTFYHGFIEDPRNHRDHQPLAPEQVTSLHKFLSRYSGNEELFAEPTFTNGFMDNFLKLINYEREINSLYKLAIRVKDNKY